MATPVMMPKVGITVESCILTAWHKKKGDTVKAGEKLFSYETDKTAVDEEAPVDGTVLDTFYGVDTEVPVMVNVCVIGNPGEDISAFAPTAETPAAQEAPAAEEVKAEAPAEVKAPVEAVLREGFIKVTPRARALAKKLGVDAHYAVPTGAEGRVCEADIRTLYENGPVATKAAQGSFAGAEGSGIGGKFAVGDIGKAVAAVAEAAPAAEFTDEKLSSIRKAIAKSMVTSLTTIPQLTHNASFDATEILAFRKKLKENMEALGLANITLNDIVIYAVSRVLAKPEHKALNANLINGDTMRYFSSVNIGIACDTPRGLMVPTIFNADKKTLNEIATESKALAAACKAGDISPDKLKGASFTISNVGNMGIESFTPVINPPQTGILGVCAVSTKVKVVNGEVKPYQAMGLSLTYDHRALDGSPASKFLVDVRSALENFSILLCK